ncbi:CAP20-like protein [Periconia macrospinosa]|uniref:CAP20-like protein n=1 Tax=Periconia macrospinosa TaxID=97972 RepID=A0A2V1D598_9PLEO|nr:CAP20-like protein [Periconia macrospinosa]
MPHAEHVNGESHDTPITNGEKPHSKVLSHLSTYPVLNDTYSAYKSHPYGQKSLSLAHQTYVRFIAPLHPYLQTPYSYVSPYLTRADELGDTGLSKVDSRFPIVKEDTSKLKETVIGYVHAPLQLVGQGKEYLLSTWYDEYNKTQGQPGLVKHAKALVSTELKLGIDGYKLAKSYLWKGKKEVNKKVN